MAANRHTCCMCHEPRHPVEKHHINGAPADNTLDNLAVLCRNCHGIVTAKGNLGTNYGAGEVLQYKKLWEKRCAEADEDEIESPIEEIHETKLIEANENEEYPFDMEEGDELVFSIEASSHLDVVLCDGADVDEWMDNDLTEKHALPKNYWCRTGIMEGEYNFVAPDAGCFVLLLVNWSKQPSEVAFDASVWESEE
jgi:hypothetical protein